MCNLTQKLSDTMMPDTWNLVRAISNAAAGLDLPLYFVGGIVRDLLLNRPRGDLDMVVEGSGIRLARWMQREYGGRIQKHPRFGTAKWHPPGFPDPIDFITARKETYSRPGALPTVKPSTIEADLHRRDFTINTLAIRLDGTHFGEFIDLHDGRADLEAGLVRILHAQSFVDDPTRIWRAVRYEQRLGFEIEPYTLTLLDEALPFLESVTPARIRHELAHVLDEAKRIAMMQRLADLSVLVRIQPGLTWRPETAVCFRRLDALLTVPLWQRVCGPRSPVALYNALWLLPFSDAIRETTLRILRVSRQTWDEAVQLAFLVSDVSHAAWTPDTRPSAVERLLRKYRKWPRVFLAAVAAFGEDSIEGQLIARYQREWQHVKPNMTGYALRETGLSPGPHYQTILDQLLAARLDGVVVTEEDERRFLQQLVEQHKGET